MKIIYYLFLFIALIFTGHLLTVFALEGQAINQKVLEDLARDYDDNMVEIILSYKDHNFNTIGTR
jgi:hypothetical protein